LLPFAEQGLYFAPYQKRWRSGEMKTSFKPCLAVAVAASVAVAGCASAVLMQSSNDTRTTPGLLGTFIYAGAGRDMRTVVLGNPFSAPKAEVDRVVTDAMQGRNNGPPTHFTTTPSENAQAGYSVVMMFDPPRGMPKKEICDDTGRPSPEPPDERIRLLTGFCAGEELLSWVVASISRVAAPTDPAFANMVSQSTRNLIPTSDDDPDGDIRED
jgi:hypothetical protein